MCIRLEKCGHGLLVAQINENLIKLLDNFRGKAILNRSQ
jgi:hypothetical protein